MIFGYEEANGYYVHRTELSEKQYVTRDEFERLVGMYNYGQWYLRKQNNTQQKGATHDTKERN